MPTVKRLDKSPKHVRNYYKAFGYDESDTILCECCGAPAVDIHHIEPRSSFGSKRKDDQDDPSNLIALCRMHHDFNQAYEGFVSRFGIEPNGILMSEETYDILKQPMEAFVIAIKEPTTFRGIPIMRSQQMEPNQIRFVI